MPAVEISFLKYNGLDGYCINLAKNDENSENHENDETNAT